MAAKLQVYKLSEHYASELQKRGADLNNIDPQIAFDIYCDAFSWEFKEDVIPMSFMIEIYTKRKDRHTQEPCTYAGFIIQFSVSENEMSDLVRVGTEFMFPPESFPELGDQDWMHDSLAGVEEDILSNPHFRKMLEAKPLRTILHFDAG